MAESREDSAEPAGSNDKGILRRCYRTVRGWLTEERVRTAASVISLAVMVLSSLGGGDGGPC